MPFVHRVRIRSRPGHAGRRNLWPISNAATPGVGNRRKKAGRHIGRHALIRACHSSARSDPNGDGRSVGIGAIARGSNLDKPARKEVTGCAPPPSCRQPPVVVEVPISDASPAPTTSWGCGGSAQKLGGKRQSQKVRGGIGRVKEKAKRQRYRIGYQRPCTGP